jgi:succinate dehydrogenase / fumarate reductase cytochrome b subunit
MNQEFTTWTGRIIYLVGILSATFHFANGLWAFCISWGIIVGPRAQRNASIVFMLFGGALTVLGLATVLEFSLHPVDVGPTFKGAS